MDLVFREMELADHLLAFRRLAHLNWEETVAGGGVGSAPFVLDHLWYAALNRTGCHCLVGAETPDGEVVGYASLFIAPAPTLGGRLVGQADAVFLHPQWRQGWNGMALLKAAETALSRRGVEIMEVRSPAHGRGMDILFQRFGARLQERVYMKELGS